MKAFITVPYRTQLDNEIDPFSTCNVTSVTMVMLYHGYKEQGGIQLEDSLSRILFNNHLSRNNPEHLAILFNRTGLFHDQFLYKASWESIKKEILENRPVIVHGYFTRFGHIVVIVGFSEGTQEWVVHDPYGEYFIGGYNKGKDKGKNVRYSFHMMDKLCAPDGGVWAHFVSKKGIK